MLEVETTLLNKHLLRIRTLAENELARRNPEKRVKNPENLGKVRNPEKLVKNRRNPEKLAKIRNEEEVGVGVQQKVADFC